MCIRDRHWTDPNEWHARFRSRVDRHRTCTAHPLAPLGFPIAAAAGNARNLVCLRIARPGWPAEDTSGGHRAASASRCDRLIGDECRISRQQVSIGHVVYRRGILTMRCPQWSWSTSPERQIPGLLFARSAVPCWINSARKNGFQAGLPPLPSGFHAHGLAIDWFGRSPVRRIDSPIRFQQSMAPPAFAQLNPGAAEKAAATS